ncbi:DNA polymerase III subunit gamma/tau [Deinococcus sp. NW-56]|uniref:DNA polymerase III subunit gamma/tau n=1 Tax=Deinococcus sp. NW-56 TaxID=2080419 RepID=UPI000CF3B620|nr:DNA polymerase III subunit gamma/tau [Deinococcus sp. NW-56]
MSAIYQRARPIRWDQVVGQEHVKDVLKTALEQGRVGHAYLFSGPRGVGKTTTARLIAMTANCTGPSPKPCGECESCLAVRAGSHPDVLEIDAASNNSVDDVRDLREKVSLAAMRGGKKIYILDEAHMMSRAAFNALLKTLEEPPGHVIFILATTEPEKIIPTILSRCQHYRFRRLTPEEIAGKLAGLAQREGMTAEPEALNLIGRLADGAMRDGESLLERMLAAGTAVTKAAVEDALGLPPGERVRGIAGALVLGDAATALQGAAQLYREGFAARTVVEGLVAAFADALHAELGLEGQALEGADVPRLLRLQAALDEQESRFARSADGLSLELALTHALLAADGGGGSAAPAGAAAVPALPADVTQRLSRLERELAELRSAGVRAAPAPTQEAPAPQPAARRSAPATPPPVQEVPASAAAPVPVQGNWADVTRQASMQLRAFLKPARMHAEPGYVSLSYDEKNAFHAKQIAAKFDEVAALVLKVFGPVTFELVAPEGGRRVRLGGGGDGPGPGGGGGGGLPRSPTPAPASPPPAQSAAPNPRADIPAFDPAPRPRATRGPDFAPVERAAPEKPVAQAAPQARAATATLDAPPPAPLRPAPPPSPDDVAPAPLAESGPAPWEDDHAADPPPPPEGAQGGDRVAPPGASRELYVVEEVTQEPNWDDIGGTVDGPPPSLEDAPFADVVPTRPAPTPRPSAPAPAPAQAAPSRPGDIRAHPLYEEIKGRFSGRVREIGKNRRVQAQAAAADGDAPDDEAEGAEAQT